METILKTTYQEEAERMRGLVGHTMSGENLERRPQVQLASGEEFLDAALRVYDITAIRLEPSAEDLSRIHVIAEYERHIFRCEAEGCEVVIDYPGQIIVMGLAEHHSWCSPECLRNVEAQIWSNIEAARAQLGDPVQATLDFLLHEKTLILPKSYHRILYRREMQEVSDRLWAMGRGGMISVLLENLASSGVSAADVAAATFPERKVEPPRWVKGNEHAHEYWLGERRLGYLQRVQEDGLSEKAGDYYCVVDHSVYTQYRGTYIGSKPTLRVAKQAVEEYWRQKFAVDALEQHSRNYCRFAFRLIW